MAIEFDVLKIQKDLEEFELNLEAIDMEKVKKETARRTAMAMAEMVRQAVVAEDDISSPARLHSQYQAGPGYSMADPRAWDVEKDGPNSYTVSPIESVRQRAYVLNFGYPGKIRADDGGYLRFTVDGEPVYRKEVDGPDETGYWQAAYQRMESSDKLRRIANDELEEEIERVFQ